MSVIIVAYPGLGKTWVANKYNIKEFHARNYYDLDMENKDTIPESLKGTPCKNFNPKFPNNYLREITKSIKINKIILMSYIKENINLLKENNIEFFILLPDRKKFIELLKLYKERGNSEKYIKESSHYYKLAKKSAKKTKKKVYWINKNKFVEDFLLKNIII